jgi:c-di-GMP-binding flagellar brake protein YcgR
MREHVKQSRHGAGDGPLEAFWGTLAARGPYRRRSYPRVHAAVPVCVGETQCGPIELISNDLSRYGMQIRCDRATTARMYPQSGIGGEEPTYPMSLRLRVSGLSRCVNTHARIVHLTLIHDAPAAQEVALGVEFVRFEDGGEKVLQRFVEQHLRPVGS